MSVLEIKQKAAETYHKLQSVGLFFVMDGNGRPDRFQTTLHQRCLQEDYHVGRKKGLVL